MARRRSRRKNKAPAWVAALLAVGMAFAYGYQWLVQSGQIEDVLGIYPEPVSIAEELGDAIAQVHIIDSGQADCALVLTREKTLLIDTGLSENADKTAAYLRDAGVTRLDYVISTHPHADHIGGMQTVLEEFPVDTILTAPIQSGGESDNSAYRRMVETALETGTALETVSAGEAFPLAQGVTLTILGPEEELEDINENSVVSRLDCGEVSFLFCGDIGREAEELLAESGADLDADVLAVPHHGSAGSSTREFLAEVTPQIATISVGLGNDYGHPTPEALERLHEAGADIFRTDINGTILLATDGQQLSIQTEKGGAAA